MNEHTPPTATTEIEQVRALFTLWVELYRNAKRPPVLDGRRENLIRKALRTHGWDTLEAAIRGVAHSNWHMGRNPQRKKYTDIELILRDAKHIEMFATLWDDHTANPSTANITAVRNLGEDW